MTGSLLATDLALLDQANPAEKVRGDGILDQILPVSARSHAFLNNAALSLHPEDMALATITLPTLAISLEDDRFGTYPAAQYIAQTVPAALLPSYSSCGHVFAGHATEIYGAIGDVLRANLLA